MRKREPISFSIDKKVLQKFKQYCDEKHINCSALIESLIKQFMEKNGKEK